MSNNEMIYNNLINKLNKICEDEQYNFRYTYRITEANHVTNVESCIHNILTNKEITLGYFVHTNKSRSIMTIEEFYDMIYGELYDSIISNIPAHDNYVMKI